MGCPVAQALIGCWLFTKAPAPGRFFTCLGPKEQTPPRTRDSSPRYDHTKIQKNIHAGTRRSSDRSWYIPDSKARIPSGGLQKRHNRGEFVSKFVSQSKWLWGRTLVAPNTPGSAVDRVWSSPRSPVGQLPSAMTQTGETAHWLDGDTGWRGPAP